VDPADWRASRRKRAEVAAIAAGAYPLIRALGATLRWRVEGRDHLEGVAAAGHQPIMAFWHGRILPAAYYFRRRGIVVITSENFDGEWIAGIIERFGYGTARGSTSRGGRRALLQLVRDMAAGKPAGFTVDGPRGPARVAQPGAVWRPALIVGRLRTDYTRATTQNRCGDPANHVPARHAVACPTQ